MKYLTYILLAISIGLIIFLLGYNVGLRNQIQEIEYISDITTDTIRDTIRIKEPIPNIITRTEERIDTVLSTVIEKDTIEIPLQLPIVEKEYSDSTYKAIIKGLEFASYPRLESLEIYRMDTYTTEAIKRENKRNKGFGFNVGIYGGYGVLNQRPDIFIGGGFGYTF